MKKYEKIPQPLLVETLCDICGVSDADEKGTYKGEGMANLKAVWGYSSKKDGEYHECDICESCYDKVKIFIESLGGTVRINQDG